MSNESAALAILPDMPMKKEKNNEKKILWRFMSKLPPFPLSLLQARV
jgi:hypothetical protein